MKTWHWLLLGGAIVAGGIWIFTRQRTETIITTEAIAPVKTETKTIPGVPAALQAYAQKALKEQEAKSILQKALQNK